MIFNFFTFTFLIATVIFVTTMLWLNILQARSISRSYHQVPDDFKDKISLKEHQKSGDYTLEKLSLNHIEIIVSVSVIIAWTILGGMNVTRLFWQDIFTDSLWVGVAFMMSIMFIGTLIDLPFSIYRHFVIEAHFGFNKMDAKTFTIDTIKGLVLFLLLATPVLYVILYLMTYLGEYWWIFVWLVLMAISLIAFWAYPAIIAPLFNKFTPLEEGVLKDKITALLKENGFSSNGVFVMDGSKRSSHGNAYFTGMGKNKRIVFFDTLLKNMSDDEVIAILAHELGHFRHNHIKKQMLNSMVITFLSLALLAFLIDKPWFYNGMGIDNANHHTTLMLFILIYPIFTLFITPIMHAMSRRYEFEADAFAAKQAGANDLISSLVKLYKENSATLTPDKHYSLMHDSHPNASLRIEHLRRLV